MLKYHIFRKIFCMIVCNLHYEERGKCMKRCVLQYGKIIGMIFLLCLSSGCVTQSANQPQQQETQREIQTVDIVDRIDTVQIQADVGHVKLKEGMQVKLEMQEMIPEWLTTTQNNNNIYLSYIPPNQEAWENVKQQKHYFCLTVPAKTVLANGEIHMGIGALSIQDTSWNTLQIHQGSGTVTMENTNAEYLTLECGAQNIQAKNLQIKQALQIYGSVGEVNIQGNLGREIHIDGGTGDMILYLPDMILAVHFLPEQYISMILLIHHRFLYKRNKKDFVWTHGNRT